MSVATFNSDNCDVMDFNKKESSGSDEENSDNDDDMSPGQRILCNRFHHAIMGRIYSEEPCPGRTWGDLYCENRDLLKNIFYYYLHRERKRARLARNKDEKSDDPYIDIYLSPEDMYELWRVKRDAENEAEKQFFLNKSAAAAAEDDWEPFSECDKSEEVIEAAEMKVAKKMDAESVTSNEQADTTEVDRPLPNVEEEDDGDHCSAIDILALLVRHMINNRSREMDDKSPVEEESLLVKDVESVSAEKTNM